MKEKIDIPYICRADALYYDLSRCPCITNDPRWKCKESVQRVVNFTAGFFGVLGILLIFFVVIMFIHDWITYGPKKTRR